jgi:hypothetical protein
MHSSGLCIRLKLAFSTDLPARTQTVACPLSLCFIAVVSRGKRSCSGGWLVEGGKNGGGGWPVEGGRSGANGWPLVEGGKQATAGGSARRDRLFVYLYFRKYELGYGIMAGLD